MIISGNKISTIAKVYGDQTKVTPVSKKQGPSPVQGKDQVILSSQAQGFSQLLQQLKATPDVRADKVQELSAKFSAGTYQVSGDKIAAKMIAQLKAEQAR